MQRSSAWRSTIFLLCLLVLCTAQGDAFGVSAGPSSSRLQTIKMSAANSKHTLYDLPVSNNGARCRILLYKKQIPESEVAIVSPTELGGLTSPNYLAVNPQGKMPALVCHNTNNGSPLYVPESDTISRYLMDTYSNTGPSFQPNNPTSNLVARFHDMYLTTIQGCLYKPSPPFGVFGTRSAALLEFRKQLQVIQDLLPSTSSNTMYLLGDQVSYADATLFPTLVFAKYMLPKFSGVDGLDTSLPAKLNSWFETVRLQDPVFARVYQEIMDVLETSWDGERKRWDTIWLAGLRDTAEPTIFDKIIRKEIPATIVQEDDHLVAFKDINPAAPAHIVIIPKQRSNLSQLDQATPEHFELLGRLLVAAGAIAKNESLGFGNPQGARIVINNGPAAGQEVLHLHVHVLGGRSMTWPPG